MSANIANSVLHIEVRDELSGIAGVQINSMLFTTVEGNKLDVDLDDNMNKFENWLSALSTLPETSLIRLRWTIRTM